MIHILLLEPDDMIELSDWCRPLQIATISPYSDTIVFENMFSGKPINNSKWIEVHRVFGEVWFGASVADVNSKLEDEQYEFVRGNIPHSHRLSLTVSEFRDRDYRQYLRCTNLQFGKYRGKTLEYVSDNDPSYLEWLIRNGSAESVEDRYYKYLNDEDR